MTITRTLAAAAVALLAAACGGGGSLGPAATTQPADTAAATTGAPTTEAPATEAPATTAAPTTVAPTTTEPAAEEGTYANPADWTQLLDNDEMTLQITSLEWQTDVSAYNFFDDELCTGDDLLSDCEVAEGKGVLVFRYDVARIAGEPGAFYFFHQLAMDNGQLVDGNALHCPGEETIDLAPGSDPVPHETCFVVDTAEISSPALLGLKVGIISDDYWVQVPITG